MISHQSSSLWGDVLLETQSTFPQEEWLINGNITSWYIYLLKLLKEVIQQRSQLEQFIRRWIIRCSGMLELSLKCKNLRSN